MNTTKEVAANVQSTFSQLVGRARRRLPSQPWETLPQPVPLVKITSQPVQPGSTSIRYVATGITHEAETILSQLSGPLYIVAFTGFGRSGKSYTATKIRHHITGNKNYSFHSAPGNVPCTHGIDMMVCKHPRQDDGHIVLLDCEGGGNHNQTALPFVIGLAARLATKIYVFERSCFTTHGLDTVMQLINMGNATCTDEVDITRDIVLVENMSINQEVPNEQLLRDLLSGADGDETTNKVRELVKDRFNVEFGKLPYNMGGGSASSHDVACEVMSEQLLDTITPFTVGSVQVDGIMVVQLVQQLLTQIRDGGNKFNMVTATEALVANMATEAALTVWTSFIEKVRKHGNHPSQINGRKHLRTVLREVEGVANTCINDLETFINRLVPSEPAIIAKEMWERNYRNFEADIRAAHKRKSEELQRYTQWADRINNLINEIVAQIVEAIRQLVRLARFSTSLILMSNYYLWKHSVNLVTGLAHGMVVTTTT
ncbi:hypothetical protein HK102_007578 [Quaeritorhiza haematococci]|nr:hypothetical protein HK102_007578 [Quaeritorhiza haematococci]